MTTFVAKQLFGEELISALEVGSSRGSSSLPSRQRSEQLRLAVPAHDPPVSFEGLTLQSKCEALEGYEVYAVEQWVVSRKPIPAMVLYTGNPKDIILVDVFTPDSHDSKRYFEEACIALQEDGARPKNVNKFWSTLRFNRILARLELGQASWTSGTG